MATFIFVGDATAVAQVDTCTIVLDATPADNVFTVTINGKGISVTGITDAETTADALVVLLNASTAPEFAEITWSNVLGVITATADTLGKSFTFASTEVGVGAGTFAQASVTANDGPEAWTISNFKGDDGVRSTTLPGDAASAVVILEDHSGDILYGLDQSGVANPWTSILIRASFTGTIGLPQSNTDGTAYDEYRPRYLHAAFGVIDIGDGAGDGSGKIRLQVKGTVSATTVRKTSSSDDDFGAVEIDGNENTITLATVLAGSVDFARDDETTGATISALSVDVTATVLVDENCTLTASSVEGGTLETRAAVGTLTIEQGIVTHTAGNITTANVLGGSLLFANPVALTVTTVTMGTAGIINANQATADVTFVNISFAPGQSIVADDGQIVLSNAGTNPANATIEELGFAVGRGKTFLWA